MSRKPLNLIPVENFLQNAKVASKTNAREIKLDQKAYKDLADCIAMLTTRLVELQDQAMSKPQEVSVNVEMDGGDF